jgi:hypothetical protein
MFLFRVGEETLLYEFGIVEIYWRLFICMNDDFYSTKKLSRLGKII